MSNLNSYQIRKRVGFVKQQRMNEVCLIVQPKKIQYDNFQLSRNSISRICIKNISPLKVYFTIDSPYNKVFQIRQENKKCLYEGQSMEIFVYFKPIENKSYEDRIEIRYNENVQTILLSAKPMKIRRKHSIPLLRSLRISNQINENKLASEQNQNNQKIPVTVDQFLKQFKEIQQFNKEKNIRNEAYKGMKALTYQEIDEIERSRVQKQNTRMEQYQTKILNRFNVELTGEAPVVSKADIKIVRWDDSKNDLNKIRENGLRKLQECMKKQIMNIRFEKVHRIWNKYLEQAKVVTRSVVLQQIESDIQAQLKSNQLSQVDIELYFSKNSIVRKLLPEHHQSITNRHFVFQINPRIGFDDEIAIEQLEENYQEIMNYENLSSPAISFQIPKSKSSSRTGNQHERPLTGPISDGQLTYFEMGSIEKVQYEPSALWASRIGFKQFEMDQKQMRIQQIETNQQIIPDQNYSLSKAFNEINFELFHYLDNSNHEVSTDCCFYNLQLDGCEMLGEPELEFKLDSEQEINWQTEINPSLRKEVENNEEILPETGECQRTVERLEHELARLKYERLRVFDSKLHSFNKFTKSRHYKFIF